MKMTLLEMVQNILSAMSSDEVNSIGDTVESMQVAEIVKETYDELFANETRPSFQGLIKLDALSDPDQPNVLVLPENVKNVEWIKYRNVDVDYRSPLAFFNYLINSSTQDAAIEVDGPNGTTMTICNNVDPMYWTTFDNNKLYFSSFNSDLEASLMQSNSLCFGQYIQSFELEDDYTPILDAELFPYLLSEAKSTCFINIRQVSSAKEDQRSRRQRIKSQNDRWRANQRHPYNQQPDYGRRRPR